MKIETKYNPGAEIHFMRNNKALKSIVRGFSAEVRGGNCTDCTIAITYFCNDEPDSIVNIKVLESEAFPTKELLINTL